jgi:hypothetical protein
MTSASSSALCNGTGQIEFFNSSASASSGRDRSASAREMARDARTAQFSAAAKSSCGSMSHLVLTLAARCGVGLASNPITLQPNFLPSTSVVPVPQNGSSKVCPGFSPKSSRYVRTRCGGKDSTNRYQSWTARSSSISRFATRPNQGFSVKGSCGCCSSKSKGTARLPIPSKTTKNSVN